MEVTYVIATEMLGNGTEIRIFLCEKHTEIDEELT